MTSTSLIPYSGGDAVQRAEAWKGLPPDERRRRAVAACMAHDAVALWHLTEVWTTLHGRAGALVSPHTRKNYCHGVETLVAAWSQENLLRPARDAAALWLRQLEAAGLKPATVQIRLAAARAVRGAALGRRHRRRPLRRGARREGPDAGVGEACPLQRG